jgi:hypothetical protein
MSASQNLPDLTVAEYDSRPEQIGRRLPYYAHILTHVGPRTIRGMPSAQVQQLIRDETNRYIMHGPSSASQQPPIFVRPNLAQNNKPRAETRKRKRNATNTAKRNVNTKNRTKRARLSTVKNNVPKPNNNSNNNLFYKANATGYIPALNYQSNNNF